MNEVYGACGVHCTSIQWPLPQTELSLQVNIQRMHLMDVYKPHAENLRKFYIKYSVLGCSDAERSPHLHHNAVCAHCHIYPLYVCVGLCGSVCVVPLLCCSVSPSLASRAFRMDRRQFVAMTKLTKMNAPHRCQLSQVDEVQHAISPENV